MQDVNSDFDLLYAQLIVFTKKTLDKLYKNLYDSNNSGKILPEGRDKKEEVPC